MSDLVQSERHDIARMRVKFIRMSDVVPGFRSIRKFPGRIGKIPDRPVTIEAVTARKTVRTSLEAWNAACVRPISEAHHDKANPDWFCTDHRRAGDDGGDGGKSSGRTSHSPSRRVDEPGTLRLPPGGHRHLTLVDAHR